MAYSVDWGILGLNSDIILHRTQDEVSFQNGTVDIGCSGPVPYKIKLRSYARVTKCIQIYRVL